MMRPDETARLCPPPHWPRLIGHTDAATERLLQHLLTDGLTLQEALLIADPIVRFVGTIVGTAGHEPPDQPDTA